MSKEPNYSEWTDEKINELLSVLLGDELTAMMMEEVEVADDLMAGCVDQTYIAEEMLSDIGVNLVRQRG
jgi:hypothetical protein